MPLAPLVRFAHDAAMSELERVLRELARLAGRLGGANDEQERPRPGTDPAEPQPDVGRDARADVEDPPPPRPSA